MVGSRRSLKGVKFVKVKKQVSGTRQKPVKFLKAKKQAGGAELVAKPSLSAVLVAEGHSNSATMFGASISLVDSRGTPWSEVAFSVLCAETHSPFVLFYHAAGDGSFSLLFSGRRFAQCTLFRISVILKACV